MGNVPLFIEYQPVVDIMGTPPIIRSIVKFV